MAGKLSLSAGILDAVGGNGEIPAQMGLMVAFLALMAALFVAGMVFFIRDVRKVRFEPAERELPPGKRLRIAWCSVSMAAYALLGVFLAIAG